MMPVLAGLSRRSDGHLWVIALGLSLFLNGLVVLGAGMVGLKSLAIGPATARVVPKAPGETLLIVPKVLRAESSSLSAAARRRFARTSDDQTASPNPEAPLEGERSTRATSDRAPVREAPALPSQAGIQPKNAEMETIESRYRDGPLDGSPATSVSKKEAAVTPPSPQRPVSDFLTRPAASSPREKLLQGPLPVDVAVVPDPAAEVRRPRQTSPGRPPVAPKPAQTEATSPPATRSEKPSFQGNQRKTAIVGSISRTGRSALDVEDTPLGRYQAVISRAVELEWQRNCVRHRDFITPGFLTVRFFVETGGKVRSVQFIGDMETGEVQKGFTLNSIRNAEIPPMPPAVRKEFQQDPLELIFRFYF